jgi:hypothetical protein
VYIFLIKCMVGGEVQGAKNQCRNTTRRVVITRDISALYSKEIQETGSHFLRFQLPDGHLISDSLLPASVLTSDIKNVTRDVLLLCFTSRPVGECKPAYERGKCTAQSSRNNGMGWFTHVTHSHRKGDWYKNGLADKWLSPSSAAAARFASKVISNWYHTFPFLHSAPWTPRNICFVFVSKFPSPSP